MFKEVIKKAIFNHTSFNKHTPSGACSNKNWDSLTTNRVLSFNYIGCSNKIGTYITVMQSGLSETVSF